MASLFEMIQQNANDLGIDLPSSVVADLLQQHPNEEECLQAVSDVFQYLRDRKYEDTVTLFMKTSRLPRKEPVTFDNFDFTQLHGQDVEQLKNLRTLGPIYAHQNLILIGPPGTGKTHLAQAMGTECCRNRMKAYFLTFSELNARLKNARKMDRVESTINGLVKPTCLIIDEVGQVVYDRDNTRLFFDVVNRRYSKEGNGSIIMTSNENSDQWAKFFTDDSSLLRSMDRLFDHAIVINVKGQSYRGKGRIQLAVEAGPSTSPTVH